MNQKIKIIITAAVLVLIMALAAVLYPKLSSEYESTTDIIGETVTVRGDTDISEPSSPSVVAVDFSVIDSEGKTVKLSDFKGKPVIVNIWATWCPPCRMEMPHFEKMYNKYSGEVEFMMINLTDGESDTVRSVSDFISDSGYTFPVYCDVFGEADSAFPSMYLPRSLFIDRDGNVINSFTGAISEEILETNVKALIY